MKEMPTNKEKKLIIEIRNTPLSNDGKLEQLIRKLVKARLLGERA